jgi:hypothetical protein
VSLQFAVSYRSKVTVPAGTVDPVTGATVAKSVTDVVSGPPKLAAVVVVVDSSGVIVGVGVIFGVGVMVTDSFAAPHALEDTANPEMADAGT